MRIGTMYFGRVEPIDRECVETKFLVIGLPLFPMESVYLLDEGSRQGIVLPQIHGTSVLAGYLRLFLGMAAVGLGIWGFVEGDAGPWVLAGLCVAAWIPAMLFLGKLSEKERAQRTVLKLLCGVGAPPELLPGDVQDESVRILERVYAKIREEDGLDVPARWRDLLGGAIPTDLRLVVWALARYSGEDHDAIWDQNVAAPGATPGARAALA